jgi:transposase
MDLADLRLQRPPVVMADEVGIGFRFLLAVLATWRVTHLIAHEDGPADLIYKMRRWMGAGFWGQLFDCFLCFSLLVAAAMAFFVASRPTAWVVSWLAISGGACLLERLSARESAAAPPVVIEKFTSAEESHGMLRTESGGSEESGLSRADRVSVP